MRVTTRTGRSTYVSIGCGGLLLIAVVVFALIGWAFSAAQGHAATTQHHAVTESYGWPQHGVTQTPRNCLAAASVTFLETYGLHVSQFRFARQDPEDNVGHAAVIINGYLRPLHARVVTAGAMDSAHLRVLLEASPGPVLVTLWTQDLPWWHGSALQGAHEIVIDKLTVTGALVWDPHKGWHTAPVGVIARSAWQYIIPAA